MKKQFPKLVTTAPKTQPPGITRSPSPALFERRGATSTTPKPGGPPKQQAAQGKPHAAISSLRTKRQSVTPQPAERAGSPNELAEFSAHRVSVLRKRQAALADAHFVDEMRTKVSEHEEEEQRRAEQRAQVREQMRQDMEAHARAKEEAQRREREERERKRQLVIQETEDIKLEEEIARQRRRRKHASERADIDVQREARRRAKEEEARRIAAENAHFRTDMEHGLKLDHDVAAQRQRETRSALVEFLNESKSQLEEKRRQQQIERDQTNRESMKSASPFLIGSETSKSVGSGSINERLMNPSQAKKITQRRAIQQAVMSSHAKQAQEREQAARRLEQAALEAEKRTAEEMAARNDADKAKALKMRSALVESLDQELSIHRDRRAAEEDEKRRLRLYADEEARNAERLRKESLAQEKARQDKLRRSLAMQISEKESEEAVVRQGLKVNQRGPFFLRRSPSP
jgi:hypothetical protein